MAIGIGLGQKRGLATAVNFKRCGSMSWSAIFRFPFSISQLPHNEKQN